MTARPRLLDLFCCAGGAGYGYHLAGFDVVGVDVVPQPNYPFEFYEADAMTFPLDGFTAIHASPPCHDHSSLSALQDDEHGTGWMLAATLERLADVNVPWVVENVGGARRQMGRSWFQLCGSSFGLGVRRHRLFASSVAVLVPPCAHHLQPEPLDVTGTGGPGGRHRKPRNLEEAREAMGMPWASRKELSQAVPPAFTEHIGASLMAALGVPA